MMLHMYFMQNWFSLSDEGIEDTGYDSHAMRSFLRMNFLEQQVPDATTLLHFPFDFLKAGLEFPLVSV